MQWNCVTMLLRNIRQLADNCMNLVLRGHHIPRHILHYFLPLVVLLCLHKLRMPRMVWLNGALFYASFPLSGTPLFRTNIFSAHTHTYAHKSKEYMYTVDFRNIVVITKVIWNTKHVHTYCKVHMYSYIPTWEDGWSSLCLAAVYDTTQNLADCRNGFHLILIWLFINLIVRLPSLVFPYRYLISVI